MKFSKIFASIFISVITVGCVTTNDWPLLKKETETAEDVVSGNVPVAPDCNVTAVTRNYGTIIPGIQSIKISSKLETGKSYEDGSVIYYAEFKDAGKYYYPQDNIYVKSNSPLNPTMVLESGRSYRINNTFISDEDRNAYDIFIGKYSIVLINQDGFVCGKGYHEDGTRAPIWNWSVSAHNQMINKIEQSPQEKDLNKKRAIAIQLLKHDDLQTTFQIARIVNDNIVESRKITVNSIKGSLDFSSMHIKFHIKNKIFYLDELVEPKNFNLTLYQVFGNNY